MPPQPYKILVVDDDKSFLSVISEMLTTLKDSIEVQTVRSGMECIQHIKRISPDLVLLDIGMHHMNGLVTFRFIKSISPSTLVYYLSGHSRREFQNAVGMVPADGYFTKTQFVDLLKTNERLDSVLSAGKVPH
jgi:CheY-like chemotaxis protein